MPIVRSVTVAIALVALLQSLPASAQAERRVSEELAGKSVRCGLGAALFFDPAMRTAFLIDYSQGPFPIAETETPIDPSRIKSNDSDRFEIMLATKDGDMSFRFQRQGGNSVHTGTGISLYTGTDDVGDDCALVKGRADFIETRFNMIRESLCGNDPKPSCEARLERTCGPQPTPACVRRLPRRPD